jgi:hypothetical protein
MKGAVGDGDYRVTNIINVHTCAIGRPYLIITMIPVMHGEFVQLIGDIVSGMEVEVLFWIGTMRLGSSFSPWLTHNLHQTCKCWMSVLAVGLTDNKSALQMHPWSVAQVIWSCWSCRVDESHKVAANLHGSTRPRPHVPMIAIIIVCR